MKEIKLRIKVQNKYNVIKKLVDHEENKNRVALKIGISKKQINCLIIKYKKR